MKVLPILLHAYIESYSGFPHAYYIVGEWEVHRMETDLGPLQETVRNGYSQSLSIAPKLKYEYVQLTSYSRMRVDLAAQVCVDSVL